MKTFLQILILFISVTIFGQQSTINEKIGYQAVVRNAANQLIQNQNIKVKVSLMIGISGEPFYIETHNTQTNNNGLFNVQIGGGISELGSYHNSIFWAGGNIFLKTEIDTTGGTNYTISSTTEFLSVPYANSAKVAWSLVGTSTYFVGFWKGISDGAEDEFLAISYISPDKFLLTNFDYDPSEYYEQTYFGTFTNTTFEGGWQAKIFSLVDKEFNVTVVVNGNFLTMTYHTLDEGDIIVKFEKMN